MAIDWNYLFEVKVDELNDEKTDALYTQLIEFNPKDEDNIERLQKLCEVCKSVMQIKSVEAEVAVEELEETAKKFDKNEIELLRKELAIFKQSDIRGENITQRLSEANDQIRELRSIVESTESENIKFKRKFNDLQNSLDLKDKEVTSLRYEVEALREEIDNQRQVEEPVVERPEPIEKLREKNRQIQRLLDELRDVETINLELANQIKKLKLELKSATNELQISCNQMEMFGQQIKELQQLNEDFVAEKQFLVEEMTKLREGLNRYESGDENIIDKYIENIRELQNLVQLKDEELVKLKSLSLVPNEELRETQKRNIRDIEEKDKQIDLLKSQLNEAVIDMESQTEIIRKLVQQNKSDEEVPKLNEKVVSLTNQLKTIETEMLAKDEELLALRKRINSYERGEYGLRDALNDLNDLNKHLQNRDQRIEEMVQQINQLKQQLNDAEDTIDGLGEDKQQNRPSIKTTKDMFEKDSDFSPKDKMKFLEMEQQLLKLEDQKISLTERLRSTLNKSVIEKQKEFKETNHLKERLKFVKTENLELQLGLKEILNGIRETDSQSDVIIECPSLERVCRLMESRSISEDLTNIIALKAELDLVRGHNEQLRTDMRRLRSDYLRVISQYTNDLLENDLMFDDSKTKDLELDSNSKNINKIDSIEDNKEEKVVKKEIIVSDDNKINVEKDKNESKEQKEQKEASNETIKKVGVNRETQTLPIREGIKSKTVSQSNNFTQTDVIEVIEVKVKQSLDTIKEPSTKTLCENCTKVIKIVEFLKNCVQKLEENIRSSETKFVQRLELLQQENKNLTDCLNEKLNEKDLQLAEKEAQIDCLQNKLTNNEVMPSMATEESSLSEDNRLVKMTDPNKFKVRSDSHLSSSCKMVLESVINCLQARLEHKDESIRQYRNMLSEAKQNFENEMIRLIESNRESDEKTSINFTQMIDNEELQSALKSCVNELEICKTELNSRITELEDELQRKNTKLMAYHNENEELRLKRTAPNSQLRQNIDELREELKQKDLVINSLNKTIRDDRAMRAMSAPKRPKDESIKREKKVDNELFQEIANLRTVSESQKETIKSLEVLKWDYEKNMKELKEQMKHKLKEKETEILELRQKLEKVMTRLNKNENEKQLLQNKVLKRENALKNSSNKSTQSLANSEHQLNKLKNELKKLRSDAKERENETKCLKRDLEVSRQTEFELKTLLEESLKREKLSTIQEEKTDWDQKYENLLVENAQIKVELRMAEFELNRRALPP